jgi:hypothetical protein
MASNNNGILGLRKDAFAACRSIIPLILAFPGKYTI